MCTQWPAVMHWRLTLALAAVVALLLAASPVDAGFIDASWIAPTTNVDGSPLTDLAFYRVHRSTAALPCPSGPSIQVASSTSSPPPNTRVNVRLTGLTTSAPINVSVAAGDTSGNVGACSQVATITAHSSVSASPSGQVNFGSVALGSFADRAITVRNIAGGTVTGTVSFPPSSPFSVVAGSSLNLVGLNASQTVTLRFRPTTIATTTANVTVAADGETVSRGVTGNGAGAASLTNLTSNLSPPRAPGAAVTFTATATGGTAPYQFKWWLWNGATWIVLRDWSASNTFTWAASLPNPNYQVGIWVRSAGETADWPSGFPTNSGSVRTMAFPIQGAVVSLTNLTANLGAPQPPSSTVTFTATAAGGTAPYQFKWWLWNGVTWAPQGNWSTTNTLAWTPSSSNPNYQVGVWVRSVGETADWPSGYPTNGGSVRAIAFPIQTPPVTVTSLTANLSAPQPPSATVTFTAVATGGTAPRQFKWWLWNGTTWTMVSNWSATNTFAWGPSPANPNYQIGVWVRGADETADWPSGHPGNAGSIRTIPFPRN